jgi:hypothetical protein
MGQICHNIVTDLINALPGSVNTVQHVTIEKAVFSVDATNAPVDWLDSDHVLYVYCWSMSIVWLYKEDSYKTSECRSKFSSGQLQFSHS